MSYEDDEARRAARARLQARMARRENAEKQVEPERVEKRTPKFSIPAVKLPTAKIGMHTREKSKRKHKGPSSWHDAVAPASSPIEAVKERIPESIPPIALAIVVAIVIVFVSAVLVIPRISATAPVEGGTAEAAETNEGAQAAETQSGSSSNSGEAADKPAAITPAKSETVQKKLTELIGEEETAKLLDRAAGNSDALWIAAHVDDYAFDGVEVQTKILKLAADEEAALPFVREFPSQYPSNDENPAETIAVDAGQAANDALGTKIPHLYQWDRRWGNTVYSSAAFGLTGCGPTSMAMVYQGLTGKDDMNPFTFSKLAQERDYMTEFLGTEIGFFTDISEEFGLDCEELYPTSDSIVEELEAGNVIIANMGPGQFTDDGHFLVLAGLDGDKVIVNDPYSAVRSSRTWDADELASEMTTMYAYSTASDDESDSLAA